MDHWPFRVVSGKDERPLFEVEYKGEKTQFNPEEISAMILSYMKHIAEEHLGLPVKNAVVTVPAYFNDSQRCATIDAAKIAGLHVVRIINEPTAAALAYGLERIKDGDQKKNVLIFDLGGGTLDVTLLEIECSDIRVKAKAGDSHLGGQDFDSRLVTYCAGIFKEKHKLDIFRSPRALSRLTAKCEEVKRMLSTTFQQKVYIDTLHSGIDFHESISRAKFEDLNEDLFEKCMNVVDLCLKDAKMDKASIHDVVLVGGSSRIPKIQELLKKLLGVNSFCKNINPDEAVACGAAVQAAMLGCAQTKLLEDIVLQDATPFSLGLEDPYGTISVIIPRNTAIPVSVTRVRQTYYDYQPDVAFKVFEGERARAVDNTLLGMFCIYDIPRALGGEVKFDVTFLIDSNSILTVTAVEKMTGKTGNVTINYDRGRLTKEEINKIIDEAKKFKLKDALDMDVSRAKGDLQKFANHLMIQIGRASESPSRPDATAIRMPENLPTAIRTPENPRRTRTWKLSFKKMFGLHVLY